MAGGERVERLSDHEMEGGATNVSLVLDSENRPVDFQLGEGQALRGFVLRGF